MGFEVMLMTILVIQNSAADPIGILGNYLSEQGLRLQTWFPLEQSTLPPGPYSGLVILGGTMNACEDEAFPHLKQVIDLIRQFSSERKPILGICLGAQLIARAFGSRVFANPVPELGFTQVYPVNSGVQDPLLQDCPSDLHMMQWHFDTFDLPAGAELLMSSQHCLNQCYRLGENIYGVQFHPEVTPAIVRRWFTFKTPWIDENYPSLFEDLEVQIDHYWPHSARFAESIARTWLTHLNSPALEVS
jgi:GMP synthase (glutamine-hydrolysing)